MKATTKLIELARNCGIACADGVTVKQIKQAYEAQPKDGFVDQHDVRLEEELKRIDDIVKASAARMASDVFKKCGRK